ncbi:FtsB family cell division protein [Acidicapsa ligni]|uniref:FtsB family cell division protein n=1 Tax=Acidicapsa ligni TaxID=542300 RepID=UPI0021E0FBB9|nr:septum formation initiator family protein [Acidicapsa ligni]
MPEPQQPVSPKTTQSWWSQPWWSETLNNRRRLGTVTAICVTLVLAWHVVNGRNGLTSWQEKRTENKALTQELDQLTQENAHLRDHVDRLKSDPGAIEFEARERLHYARPNEVIYALPETSGKSPATK